jgi:3-hydroxyacyl-CoA dehydrogenase
MGPFQMIDLVGLDVIGWDREHSAGRTVQEILCEAGDWGQKTGAGYYDHRRQPPVPSARAEAAVARIAARSGLPQRAWSDTEILEALLDPVVNEAVKLIEEGMVYRASDIDMALIAGYGWPVYRGGPIFRGDTVGLAAIVARLDARAAQGEVIAVSPLLRETAATGGRFVRD